MNFLKLHCASNKYREDYTIHIFSVLEKIKKNVWYSKIYKNKTNFLKKH